MNRLNSIVEIATEFRAAIDRLDKSEWSEYWYDFPRGMCGITSDILGTLLEERGHGSFECVSGSIGESFGGNEAPSHAWLEREGLIIDVTADQFDVGLPSVIVVSESEWHGDFLSLGRRLASIQGNYSNPVADLEWIYDEIVREMKI